MSAALVVGAGGAQAAGGVLDPSFGTGGKALTAPRVKSDDRAFAAVVQADGKVVVAGYSNGSGRSRFALIRYTAAGKLDASFGSGGKVLTDFGVKRIATAFAVAIQKDEKIVAAGSSAATNGKGSDFALVRYTPAGKLDTSFGSRGKVLTDLGGRSEDSASAVAVQRDGRIVVGGSSEVFNSDVGWTDEFALVRYMPGGKLDSSFGTGGKVLTRLGAIDDTASASAVAVQKDRKIVAVGRSGPGGYQSSDFALVRYTTRGKLDASFGSGGEVLAAHLGEYSNNNLARAVAIQKDGKIVAVGESGLGDRQYSDFALFRYTTRGRLDSSFGSGGKLLTDLGGGDDSAAAVAVQKDGKIVAAGRRNDAKDEGDFALVRYDANGRLDERFGARGKVLTDLGAKSIEAISALALQKDGKIVAAGYSDALGSYDFTLVRYTTRGKLDTSFGGGGRMLTDFATS